MWLLIIIGVGLLLLFLPTLRCAVLHPVKTVGYGAVDLYRHIRYQRWNECQTGELVAYVGLFGKGKTLSAVHKVVQIYKRYDGKPVWDRDRKKFVTQRVKVLSNVALQIPYEDFVSLQPSIF